MIKKVYDHHPESTNMLLPFEYHLSLSRYLHVSLLVKVEEKLAKRLKASRHILLAMAWGYLLIATFPGYYHTLQPGLDPSWVYGINYLAQSSEYLFGRDVVFTYGPLGYLAEPVNIGSNILIAQIVRLMLHCLFAIALFYSWRRSQKVLPIVSFAVVYLVSYILWLRAGSFDFYVTTMICLLIGITLRDPQHRLFWLPLVAFLSAVALFIKFNAGVCTAGLMGLTAMVIGWRQKAWKPVLVSGLVYLLTVAVLTAVLLGSVFNLGQWLRGSIEIADAYNSTMSLPGSRRALVSGLAALLVWTALVLWLLVRKLPLRYAALVFSFAVFIAFKSGFVRQDCHVEILFLFTLPITGILILNSERWDEFLPALVALFIFLGLSIHPIRTCSPWKLSLQAIKEIILVKHGAAKIASLLNLGETRSRLDAERRTNIQSKKLPQDFLKLIDTDKQTVSILPWELSYIPANNFRFNPLPTLQTYVGYTVFLDNLNANYFESEKGPDFVIVSYESIDGRHLLLDNPAMWRSLLAHYEVLKRIGGALLLRRKPPSSAVPLLEIVAAESVPAKQWIPVSGHHVPLYVSFDLSLTLIGKVVKTLYKIPEVQLECAYESGRTAVYRIPPEVTPNGLLINYLPDNLGKLSNLFSCHARDRVNKFRIVGPGLTYFYPSFDLTWKKGAPAHCESITPQETTSDAIALRGSEELLSLLPESFAESPTLRLVPSGLFMHTNGRMEFGPFRSPDGLCFRSGAMIDPAVLPHPQSDGADFVSSVITDHGLFAQQKVYVDRSKSEAMQLKLPTGIPFTILLETFERQNAVYDWAVWQNPQFNRCE